MTMETKQTAVIWLELKLNLVKPTDFCSIETIKDWIKQAKAMEKEQIEEGYLQGMFARHIMRGEAQANKYYNETYGTPSQID